MYKTAQQDRVFFYVFAQSNKKIISYTKDLWTNICTVITGITHIRLVLILKAHITLYVCDYVTSNEWADASSLCYIT